MKSKSVKVYYPETIDDIELPDSILWEDIVDAPQTLADLDASAQAQIDGLQTDVDLGFADISIQGWTSSITFSAGSNVQVNWSSGVIQFKDGQTFNIVAGNTGAMAGVTYIYLDKSVSTTVLQKTTDSANAVGVNKLLVAVAQNVASGKSATYQAFGGKGGMGVLITADNIASNSITANEIQTNTITTLNLTAGSITGLSISAVTITGSTITGSTLTTANSGQRVVLTTTLAQYYNSSGTKIIETYADSNSFLIKGSQSNSLIVLDAGPTGSVLLSNDEEPIVSIDSNGIFPWTNGVYDNGVITRQWKDIWNNGTHIYRGIDQPIVFYGTAYDGDSYVSEDNTPGWSITHPSTGVYRIYHNLGTYDYSAVIIPSDVSSTREYVVSAKSSNYFQVRIYNNATASLTDVDFMFILTTNSY